MGWFSRKQKTGPLWDHLLAMTPERSAAMLQTKANSADDPDKFLKQIIFTILQTCTGSFLKGSGEFALKSLGKGECGCGRLSLDFRRNIELRAHLHSFAVTMPKAMAEAIQGAISEYGLLD